MNQECCQYGAYFEQFPKESLRIREAVYERGGFELRQRPVERWPLRDSQYCKRQTENAVPKDQDKRARNHCDGKMSLIRPRFCRGFGFPKDNFDWNQTRQTTH